MNIHNVHILYLLLLVPLFIWLILRMKKAYESKFRHYAHQDFLDVYLAKRSPFYNGLKLFLLLAAFSLIIVALARPQWDFSEQEMSNMGMDIIFAIDISRSMEATDISPDRLTRSILQVSAFCDQLDSDRLGIISFAGSATVECPLTDDHEAVKMVLSSLSTDSAARPGTDIGRALDLARSAFNAGAGGGVLILISDGEDITGNTISKARDLASDGVRIYSMGVGSEAGAVIINPYTGAEHVSKLDTETLQRIARVSGGEFYHITPSASEIQLLLSRIYQSEKEHISSHRVSMYKEQYHIFVIAALLIIALESMILPYRKQIRDLKL
ncbi:MAG: VWA domain-containing protein [Candidatus Cloacimonetes bacterium]|jgi:Ca-activated chloride channel family protein|nr:VWA domain-containing protein [Candidatus Cloacimonadota bacterium]MDD2506092.1 VWA domain-containing protein [Candidatus Cloacimonadota bacterium]MDD4559675.1 VWA domain-containing protein [Candidatus Cloacimonadota bacterium]